MTRLQLTERNDRTWIKLISEPKKLYRFRTTPGFEVTNLTFASDDVVCVSWKYAAEEHVPSLRHTNEVYILDVFSEFLYLIPVKTKSGPSVASAFRSIFDDDSKNSRGPVCVRIDKGKEFLNEYF